MPRKTLHRVLTAITFTLAALLTTTQAIAAPETEGKSGAVKPAASTQAIAAPNTLPNTICKMGAVKPTAEGKIPPFCEASVDQDPATISCGSGKEPAYYMQTGEWLCCSKCPYDLGPKSLTPP